MLQRTLHRHPPAVAGRDGPPWRLLIESPDGAAAISDFTAFRDAGFAIMLCEGPAEHDLRECPVVRGAVCPFVAEADVVLFDLDADRPGRAEILAAVRASRPELPVVVRTAVPDASVPEGCTVIPRTTSVRGQVRVLGEAVDATGHLDHVDKPAGRP